MRKLLLLGALALGAGSHSLWAADGSTIAPPKVPVADFAALPAMSKPILSPNGRWIAARTTANGTTTFVILDADKPDTIAKSIYAGKVDVASLAWAGNKRLLLRVLASETIAPGFELPFLRLVGIDLLSGHTTVLDRKSRGIYAGDVLYTDPEGDWSLVASQDDIDAYPSVKRVDLATGKATVVEKARDKVWDWYADDKGVVRAGVAYEGRKWTVWYRDKAEEKLRAIHGKLSKDDDSAVDKFIFRGNSSWIVTNERTGRFGLYKYDMTTGTVGDTIFENPDVDLKDVLYDAVTGEITAVEFEDDRRRINWLDPEMKALQAKIDKALPATVNATIDWSTDDKRVLVWSAGGSDPGRYFLLDRSNSRMHTVVDPYPRIEPSVLAEVKPVRYQARDGLAINAYLTLPKGREAKGLPLVLFPHSGPFERDHWEYDPMVQFLANRGYAVLQPEFRGSTGYGKDFVARGYGEWGRKMQDDLDDGVDWLARSGQIDAKRVCIVGGSYGGYAAMWGAIRNPDRYRCAASMAGVADLPAMLRYDKKLFSATRYYREWRSKVGGEGSSDLRSISPLNFAAQLKVPLLIAHGEEDSRVPIKQSKQMVEALTKAHADVTSVYYKDSGHGFDSEADLEDWLRRLEGFLTKYNPA
jgi:dipeptidyl aminopeptidase/acylaminoacyl peptidase